MWSDDWLNSTVKLHPTDWLSPGCRILLRLANEVCEGYVFTPVCHSVHGGVPALGEVWSWGGACSGGSGLGEVWSWCGGVPAPGGLVLGGVWSLGGGGGTWRRPPETATAVGGTHPTGMHSCFDWIFNYEWQSETLQGMSFHNKFNWYGVVLISKRNAVTRILWVYFFQVINETKVNLIYTRKYQSRHRRLRPNGKIHA